MHTRTEMAKCNIFYNKLVHFTQIQILLMEVDMFLLIWHHTRDKFVIIFRDSVLWSIFSSLK